MTAIREQLEALGFKSTMPIPAFPTRPLCMVSLFVKDIGIDKKTKKARLLRDRNTVLVTKLGTPRWAKHVLENKDILAHHTTPDGFLFASLPASEAAYLM